MRVVWMIGPSTIRDIRDALPANTRTAYTTVQTMVYRLEKKKIVIRTNKIGKRHAFAALIPRATAERGMVEDVLKLLGWHPKTLLLHLVKTGRVDLSDLIAVREALHAVLKEHKPNDALM